MRDLSYVEKTMLRHWRGLSTLLGVWTFDSEAGNLSLHTEGAPRPRKGIIPPLVFALHHNPLSSCPAKRIAGPIRRSELCHPANFPRAPTSNISRTRLARCCGQAPHTMCPQPHDLLP